MNKWEAQYKALAAAINDETYIENAKVLVENAAELSRACGMPFEEAVYAMLKTTGLIQSQAEPVQSLAEAFKTEHWFARFIRKIFKKGGET